MEIPTLELAVRAGNDHNQTQVPSERTLYQSELWTSKEGSPPLPSSPDRTSSLQQLTARIELLQNSNITGPVAQMRSPSQHGVHLPESLGPGSPPPEESSVGIMAKKATCGENVSTRTGDNLGTPSYREALLARSGKAPCWLQPGHPTPSDPDQTLGFQLEMELTRIDQP